MFFWLCPRHGHCYGGHLISGGEGRKDPMCSLLKYMREAPPFIFYDNACQLSEYSLSRSPRFFSDSQVYHDNFHSFTHTCSNVFTANGRVRNIASNTSICEQFNAYMANLKGVASGMKQEHFMFLVQCFVSDWNAGKTETLMVKLDALRKTPGVCK